LCENRTEFKATAFQRKHAAFLVNA